MAPEFEEIARDLLNLEINTILKNGMSARKMPEPADAVIDLAQDYHAFTCERAREIGFDTSPLCNWSRYLSESIPRGVEPFMRDEPRAFVDGSGAAIAPGDVGVWSDADYLTREVEAVGLTELSIIRGVAEWLREMRRRTRAVSMDADLWGTLRRDEQDDVELTPERLTHLRAVAARFRDEHDPVLFRVQRTCDQLKLIVPRLLADRDAPKERGGGLSGWVGGAPSRPALPAPAVNRDVLHRRDGGELRRDDAVIVRKAWDIGTEVVVMQTLIQIDGDVVTRIAPGRETAASVDLQRMHGEAVQVSLQHWRSLVTALRELASAVVGGLRGARG